MLRFYGFVFFQETQIRSKYKQIDLNLNFRLVVHACWAKEVHFSTRALYKFLILLWLNEILSWLLQRKLMVRNTYSTRKKHKGWADSNQWK